MFPGEGRRACNNACGYGGIGRRKGLKIPRGQPRAGSSPATRIWRREAEHKRFRFCAVSCIICARIHMLWILFLCSGYRKGTIPDKVPDAYCCEMNWQAPMMTMMPAR